MRECPECRNAIEDAARFCPICGAASAAAPVEADPWIGTIVNGKFRIEALVGQGGMGRVYRAKHLTLDRQVVLKMLHKEYSSDPQVVQRFQREARAASRLNHANSIAVLDFGEAEDGTLFMAMEFLSGKDLANVIAGEFPLGEARIVRIAAQILSALSEAHAQGIIHRDLKPENVMIEQRRGEADFVKVLDFGIAKITAPGANEPKLTAAGLVCGTPEYMSPEQARGADLDTRTDLYSMGVILYQMATGELPFQSDTPVGFLTKHLAEMPVPARERWADVSEGLEAIISKAMEKDAARRYQTADEMRAALLALEGAGAGAAAPIPARTASATPPPRPATAAAAGRPSGAAAARPPASAAALPPGRTAAAARAPTAQVGPPEPAPAPAPQPRSKLIFWAFAGAVVLAAAGGGAVAYFARQNQNARKGTPEVVSPAQAQGQVAAVPAATPPATPAPTPPATPAATPTPTPAVAVAPPPPPVAVDTAPTPTPTPAPPPVGPSGVKRPARADPAKALALYRKGEARRADQDMDGAIKLYLQAEAADPGLADVQKKLALCYQLKGDTRRAADRYRKYLATKPADAERVRAILSTLE